MRSFLSYLIESPEDDRHDHMWWAFEGRDALHALHERLPRLDEVPEKFKKSPPQAKTLLHYVLQNLDLIAHKRGITLSSPHGFGLTIDGLIYDALYIANEMEELFIAQDWHEYTHHVHDFRAAVAKIYQEIDRTESSSLNPPMH